jgi:hypothetical protein
MTHNIKLYQVAYNVETLAQVQASGFLVLDNLANPRPDWYEYWPIRHFLLTEPLDESAFYGFFSPKFTYKTQMTHADVCAFLDAALAKGPVDVALFSPQPDMGAHFLNVFEQAELFDPGCLQVAKDFLQLQGLDVPLEGMVMDSRQTVFSNYFVARPAFWRLWFGYTEALFAIAEDATHPLNAALNFNTTYGENANRKVFISERLASLLLCLRPEFRTVTANTFNFGWSTSRFREHPNNAYINDALKMAFRESGFPQYMDAFRAMRESFTQDAG